MAAAGEAQLLVDLAACLGPLLRRFGARAAGSEACLTALGHVGEALKVLGAALAPRPDLSPGRCLLHARSEIRDACHLLAALATRAPRAQDRLSHQAGDTVVDSFVAELRVSVEKARV